MKRIDILYSQLERLRKLQPDDYVSKLKLMRLKKQVRWEINTARRFKLLYDVDKMRN